MKRLPELFLFLIFFASCSREKIPKDILPKEKMQQVMWDIIRADEFVTTYIMRDTSLNKENENFKLYNQVFSIHKITENEFKKSLSYYESRPDLMKIILDSLSNKRYVEEQNEKRSKKDSLNQKKNQKTYD